ncbi:MAG: DUF2505 domain-containing protein [Rhodococcus sp. (in: high G+C Gram-positive bacteria)]
MSRSFEHTLRASNPPAEVHAALTSEDQWMARFAKAKKTDGYELTKHADGGLTVDISEEVGTNELPGFVTKVIKGKLIVSRTDYWGPLEGDHAEGTLTGSTTGLPAKITGTLSLQPDGTGAKLLIKGESTVKIPLVGGKIEDLINKMIKDMIDQETGESLEWVAAQKS